MGVIGQSVDPFDLIQHHMDNLGAIRQGRPVRDLAESAAGFDAAIRHLRGAVEALRAEAAELRAGSKDPARWRMIADADVADMLDAHADRFGGQ